MTRRGNVQLGGELRDLEVCGKIYKSREKYPLGEEIYETEERYSTRKRRTPRRSILLEREAYESKDK